MELEMDMMMRLLADRCECAFPSPLRGEGGARSAPGEGNGFELTESVLYFFKHDIRAPQDITIPESKNVKAVCSQIFVAQSIF